MSQLQQGVRLLEAQNKHLLKVLADKCAQLDQLQGRSGELQAVLDGLNAIGNVPSTDTSDAPAKTKTSKAGKQRGHGPTPQPQVEHVTQRLELDEADQTCPSCGHELKPKAGEFETSEMVDVVEVSSTGTFRSNVRPTNAASAASPMSRRRRTKPSTAVGILWPLAPRSPSTSTCTIFRLSVRSG